MTANDEIGGNEESGSWPYYKKHGWIKAIDGRSKCPWGWNHQRYTHFCKPVGNDCQHQSSFSRHMNYAGSRVSCQPQFRRTMWAWKTCSTGCRGSSCGHSTYAGAPLCRGHTLARSLAILKKICKWRFKGNHWSETKGGISGMKKGQETYCRQWFFPRFCTGINNNLGGCRRYYKASMRRRYYKANKASGAITTQRRSPWGPSSSNGCHTGLGSSLYYQARKGETHPMGTEQRRWPGGWKKWTKIWRNYRSVHGQKFTKLSNYRRNDPVYSTYIKNINFQTSHGWKGSRSTEFQIRTFGYLNIARAGSYKFCLRSDGGSQMQLGKRGATVLKNKGGKTQCRSANLRRGSQLVIVTAFHGRGRFNFIWKYKGADTANKMVLVGTKGPLRQCKKPVYKPYKNTKRTQTVCGSSVVRPRCHGAGCHYRKSYNHGGTACPKGRRPRRRSAMARFRARRGLRRRRRSRR